MNQLYVAGYSSSHPSDFTFDIPAGIYKSYLFILNLTASRILYEGKMQEVPAGTCTIYTPGQRIYYQANGQEYSDDWMYFNTDEPEILEFPLTNTPILLSDPGYCHNLLQLITWESGYVSNEMASNPNTPPQTSFRNKNHVQIISDLIHIVFAKVYENVEIEHQLPYSVELDVLRKKIYAEPALTWNVQSMAHDLHISPSYLHLLYKQKFGISCIDDVISSRILHAKKLLQYTGCSMFQISEECGYQSVEHFSRQFKKRVGITPGAFRKSCDHII